MGRAFQLHTEWLGAKGFEAFATEIVAGLFEAIVDGAWPFGCGRDAIELF